MGGPLRVGGATEGDDGGLPSPDRVRITLDLDQGKLDGLPLAGTSFLFLLLTHALHPHTTSSPLPR